MTKEELEKEAEEYALEKCKECYMCNSEENGERGYCPKLESRKEGYIAGAELREKQIKIDAEQIRALQKQNGELTDKVKELEAQIEKMKCCPNCDFIFRDGNCYYDKECKNKDHWKLRR